jgi:hypothetical protein
MTVVDSESITEEFDDEFDLDVRITDLDPAGSNLTPTHGTSCTMCCPGDTHSYFEEFCRTRGCTEYSECVCTGDPC